MSDILIVIVVGQSRRGAWCSTVCVMRSAQWSGGSSDNCSVIVMTMVCIVRERGCDSAECAVVW